MNSGRTASEGKRRKQRRKTLTEDKGDLLDEDMELFRWWKQKVLDYAVEHKMNNHQAMF
jgi:hypothetical protein